MASGRASWVKRHLLFRTPFYKLGPCGNYHPRLARLCYCRVNEFTGGWHGTIYSFREGGPVDEAGKPLVTCPGVIP